MRLVRLGRRRAFATLVARHAPVLRGFFLRLGADAHSAEDCVQETFVRLFTYRRRYRPMGRFRAFLFTLARHAWADWRAKERPWAERAPWPDGGAEEALAPCAARDEDRLALAEALLRLPEGQRAAVVLTVIHGFRYREAAEILGVPEGTVKSRVYYGLRKMRVCLAARERRG